VAKRSLGRTCKAHFRPLVPQRVRYRAVIGSDATYDGATSAKVGLRPAHARRAKATAKGGSGRA
jgi:hypothetical protein